MGGGRGGWGSGGGHKSFSWWPLTWPPPTGQDHLHFLRGHFLRKLLIIIFFVSIFCVCTSFLAATTSPVYVKIRNDINPKLFVGVPGRVGVPELFFGLPDCVLGIRNCVLSIRSCFSGFRNCLSVSMTCRVPELFFGVPQLCACFLELCAGYPELFVRFRNCLSGFRSSLSEIRTC